MSFRQSASAGDALQSFSRSGARTPLRSLQNEILPSTESPNVKSKPLVSSEPVKHAKVIVALEDALKNASANGTDGTTAQSSQQPSEQTSYSSEEPDIERTTSNSTDITLKSYECDGGEVEISDKLVEKTEDSIALPPPGLREYTQYIQTLDTSCISDVTEDFNFEEQEMDHLYCKRERGAPSPISKGEILQNDKATDAMTDITLKFLNCMGGEIEIGDSVHLYDQTIPLPAGQSGSEAESYNDGKDSAIFTEEVDHTEHPYCNKRAVDSLYVTNKSSVGEVLNEKDQTEKEDDYKDDSLINPKLDGESCNTSAEGQFCQLATNSGLKQTDNHLEENGRLQIIKNETVDASLTEDVPPLSKTGQSENRPETTQEESQFYRNKGAVDSFKVINEPSVHEVLNENDQTEKEDDYEDDSLINPGLDDESCNTNVEAASFVSEEQFCQEQLATNSVLKQTENYTEKNDTLQEIKNEIVDASLPEDASLLFNTSQSENHRQAQGKSHLDLSSMGLSQHSAHHETISAPPDPNPDAEEKKSSESELEVHSSVPHSQGSDTTDSALGLSPNVPAPVVGPEPPQAKTLPHVFKAMSECTPLQLKFLTPIVRRASLACKQVQKELGIDQDELNPAEVWREQLDSPMPRPLFNSTELVHRSQPCVVTETNEDVSPVKPAVNKAIMEVIPEGQLQQQLRQMAEFLMLASGKMGLVQVPAPPPKAEHHSVCVGTTPMKMVNHSVNTSGQFERTRSVFVEDQETMTDPLLWNVPAGSLESVPKPELEQRLLSSMIIVEALVQQLGAARAQTLPPAGAAPSQLRERAAQTEHTELSQTSMHKDLYLEALNRIQELEMDATSLQSLIEYMQNVKTNMTVLSRDTEAALSQMKLLGNVVTEDHSNLVSNYAHMKSLVGRSRETQVRMIQKVKDALQDREDMRTQMEEAFSAKDAAYSVMEQLRKHCSAEISELEKCVGSQQELLCALRKAHPEQVALNKVYSETLTSASELLSKTTEEQSSLRKELCAVRGLLQKCTPIFLRLNEKTDAALKERDERIVERDQAVQDKLQTEEELNQALQNLQKAKEQISDLNLQVTILTSEMGVLRQKLSESDEERAQLDRKATELSATVSSTLASYAFLEQTLASEMTKLQQSWTDTKQAKERAQELELSLARSELRVSELLAALAHSEAQVSQLSSVSETRALQLQQLQEKCAQLRGVCEENEFLQMENELSREQMVESERMLRENLQSLRERNIQCEDLNTEFCQLQHANKNLQEELESVRTKLSVAETEHKEKLEQIVTEIAILHHTVRSLTNELHASIKEELSDQPSPHIVSPGSFVDSVTSAPITEKEETPKPAPTDSPDAPSHPLFSENSAFMRVTAVTPKRRRSSNGSVEEQSRVSELLVGLDSTVTELRNTMTSVQQRKDAQLKERHEAISRLQRELEAANDTHQTEVSELQFELNRLKARMEKANATLQQRAQGEKTVSKLVADISEIQEMHNKHKADNNELRKEVVELRRSLQQSKSEARFLRDELKKHGAQSAPDFMDEKIGLLKEVEKLKMSLQAEEQARNKLLERAKRHQGIFLTNQQKSEKELQMLNNMINKVRETLLSLPASVRKCEQLQQLIEYVG